MVCLRSLQQRSLCGASQEALGTWSWLVGQGRQPGQQEENWSWAYGLGCANRMTPRLYPRSAPGQAASAASMGTHLVHLQDHHNGPGPDGAASAATVGTE